MQRGDDPQTAHTGIVYRDCTISLALLARKDIRLIVRAVNRVVYLLAYEYGFHLAALVHPDLRSPAARSGSRSLDAVAGYFEYLADLDNRLLTRNLNFTPLQLNFDSGDRLSVETGRNFERSSGSSPSTEAARTRFASRQGITRGGGGRRDPRPRTAACSRAGSISDAPPSGRASAPRWGSVAPSAGVGASAFRTTAVTRSGSRHLRRLKMNDRNGHIRAHNRTGW
jgi:hypothetical protein